MADGSIFRHGAVQFPLTSSTSNSLLRDADPAIYWMLDLFARSLRKHIGPRLTAQALTLGLKITDAVAKTIHLEPSPFLLASDFKFPLLALYRRSGKDVNGTVVFDADGSNWEFAYVLPSLVHPMHLAELHPILHAAERVISHAARHGRDPDIDDGASFYDRAGLERASVSQVDYGVYEPIDGDNKLSFRAVVGTISAVEMGKSISDTLEALNGITGNVSVGARDGTAVPDVASASTYPAPTVTSIVPSLGTKAGGTTVTITGTNFRVGTPVRVVIGGTECSGVEVLSSTQVRAVTGAHEAYPTFAADVDVVADDTQRATLPIAFEYTTP